MEGSCCPALDEVGSALQRDLSCTYPHTRHGNTHTHHTHPLTNTHPHNMGTHTHVHTHKPTHNMLTYMHTTHACTLTPIPTHTHIKGASSDLHENIRAQECMLAHTHTHTHTHMHACTPTHPHPHTHVCTHTLRLTQNKHRTFPASHHCIVHHWQLICTEPRNRHSNPGIQHHNPPLNRVQTILTLYLNSQHITVTMGTTPQRTPL